MGVEGRGGVYPVGSGLASEAVEKVTWFKSETWEANVETGGGPRGMQKKKPSFKRRSVGAVLTGLLAGTLNGADGGAAEGKARGGAVKQHGTVKSRRAKGGRDRKKRRG